MSKRLQSSALSLVAWWAAVAAAAQDLGGDLGDSAAAAMETTSPAPDAGPYYGGLNLVGWAVTVGSLLVGWLLIWILFFLLWRQMAKNPHDSVRWAYGLTALGLILVFCFGIWPNFGFTHTLPNLLGWVVAGVLFVLIAIMLLATRRTA